MHVCLPAMPVLSHHHVNKSQNCPKRQVLFVCPTKMGSHKSKCQVKPTKLGARRMSHGMSRREEQFIELLRERVREKVSV